MHTEEGETIWERTLNSNGKAIKGDNGACPFLYQGQYYDEEIELAYNRFRYYDSEDGRYISQDPIGLDSGEFNLYNYVKDTNHWLDLFGLSAYAPTHHIATNKHKKWAPKFEKLFKKHGLDKFKNGRTRKHPLNNPLNKVDVVGHKGPHSEAGFHEAIYDRLSTASKKGTDSFKAELAKMKVECANQGSDMNTIITKTY